MVALSRALQQGGAAAVRLLRRFVRGRRGFAAAWIALIGTTLVTGAGLALDGGRAYLGWSKLAAATDHAAIAAAQAMLPANIDSEATAFVARNFPSDYLGATITSIEVTRPTGRDDLIKVCATARVPTSLIAVAGIQDVDVSACSLAERMISDVDLALAIPVSADVFGLDAAGTRYRAIKDQAQRFIDMVWMGDPTDTSHNVFAGLVPFAGTVRAVDQTNLTGGSARRTMVDTANVPTDLIADSRLNWQGCIEERDRATLGNDGLPLDLSLDPPTSAARRFRAYYWLTTNYLFQSNSKADFFPLEAYSYSGVIIDQKTGDIQDVDVPDSEITRAYLTVKSDTLVSLQGTNTVTNQTATVPFSWDEADHHRTGVGTTATVYIGDNFYRMRQSHPSSYPDVKTSPEAHKTGPNIGCPAHPILPLKASGTTVKSALAGLATLSRGGSFDTLGLVWAGRLLGDQSGWESVWSSAGASGAPRKVIVLLTAGQYWNDYKGETRRFATGGMNFLSDGVGALLKTKGSFIPMDTDYSAYGRLVVREPAFHRPVATSIDSTIDPADAASLTKSLAALDQRFLTLCDSLRAQGVRLYTIALAGAPGNPTQAPSQAVIDRNRACVGAGNEYRAFAEEGGFLEGGSLGRNADSFFTEIAADLLTVRLVDPSTLTN